jgi:DNA-binding CsgD family transcriptional regulator/tetratricopeptide (TPR) repeat protein
LELPQGMSAARLAGGFAVPLLKAARRLEPLDIGLPKETYLDAWVGAAAAGPFATEGQLLEICAAALAAPAVPGPPRPSDLLMEGYATLDLEGRAAALPVLREAVAAFAADELSLEKTFQWSAIAGRAAGVLWDFEHMDLLFCRPVEPARSAGALVPLCFSLSGQVLVVTWRGELAAATAQAAEADALAEAIGIRFLQFGTSLLAALRGDENESPRQLRSIIDRGTESRDGTPVHMATWANAVLWNGLAQYDRARQWAGQAGEVPAANIAAWALPELVEAAVRTGHESQAIDAFERLTGNVEGSEGDWGQGILARSRALLSDDQTAEDHYREAIECLGRTALRPELARALLLYGEWLRRRKRRRDAREQLRLAYDMFDGMGMIAFAQRARRELRATGESVRKRRDDTRSDLTAQEEQIAHLAREGRTAQEIGDQLFISGRTVEWHLRKVFVKLGITSRRGLAEALPAPPGNAGRP